MRKTKTCNKTWIQSLARIRKCFRERGHSGDCIDKYGPFRVEEEER